MRYRVNDLPIKGRGAFTPTPTTNPAASSFGLVRVSAALGLAGVPSPTATHDLPPTSFDPRTQPGNCAPDVIFRDTYVAYADNMGPQADAGIGMAMRRMNPMPVPAVSGILTPNVAFRPRRAGGRKAMNWPRSFQNFG